MKLNEPAICYISIQYLPHIFWKNLFCWNWGLCQNKYTLFKLNIHLIEWWDITILQISNLNVLLQWYFLMNICTIFVLGSINYQDSLCNLRTIASNKTGDIYHFVFKPWKFFVKCISWDFPKIIWYNFTSFSAIDMGLFGPCYLFKIGISLNIFIECFELWTQPLIY